MTTAAIKTKLRLKNGNRSKPPKGGFFYLCNMTVYVSGLIETFDNETKEAIRIHDLKVYEVDDITDAMKEFLYECHFDGYNVLDMLCAVDGKVITP